jgi:hypothetical protein
MNDIHPVALFRYSVLGPLISRGELPRGELTWEAGSHMGSGVTHGKRGQVFHYDMVRVIRDKPRLLRNVKNRLKKNTPDPQSAARFVGRVVLIVMRQK